MKTYLLKEGKELFRIKAESKVKALFACEMYNATFIKEIK